MLNDCIREVKYNETNLQNRKEITTIKTFRVKPKLYSNEKAYLDFFLLSKNENKWTEQSTCKFFFKERSELIS